MSLSASNPSAPPAHVAIIMDGNGRWARQRGLPRIEGHRRGVDNVRAVVDAAHAAGVQVVTLYAFSVENWQRPSAEIEALMSLLEHTLGRYSRELVEKGVQLRSIGEVETLPKRVQKALAKAVEKTAGGSRGTLVLALNYGARQEIVRVCRAVAEAACRGEAAPETLDWASLRERLDTCHWPDPDLIIRTSGESRLSNFLLLQSAYSELYFTPVFWPDFGPEQLHAALGDYARRERRFGRTTEQLHPAEEAPAAAPAPLRS